MDESGQSRDSATYKSSDFRSITLFLGFKLGQCVFRMK